MGEKDDIGRLSTSRRYNQWLGGKDHYAADRESTATIVGALPSVVVAAREGRAMLLRAVRHLVADLGIRQILDIGAGQPITPNVHEVAQAADPGCRVLYVDNDPLVGVHHRGTIVSSPEGAAEFAEGDLLDAEKVIEAAGAVLDLDQPVAVLLSSVLHLIDDDARAHEAVRTLIAALAPGSYLVIVHGTFDTLPAEVQAKAQEIIDGRQHGVYRARSRAEVAAFVDGLELVEPGLVSSVEWRPGPDIVTSVTDAMCWTVVARVS
ncbi:SAM-dependent methyltransferase [Actinoplanes ianthinogenes]|nr:SAM-dependent methyltransferase [Actinoplanes ianthinogenes]